MSMMASGAAGGEEGSGPKAVSGYKRLNKVPSYAQLDTLYYRASNKAVMEWKVNMNSGWNIHGSSSALMTHVDT